MTLAEALDHQLENRDLSQEERIRLQCQLADELEQAGRYEAARDALGTLWQGVGNRPALDGASQRATAEVLLRVGTLSSWFAGAHRLADALAAAKDLISESASIFLSLGDRAAASVAQSELALCYWREGAFDEARVIYREAFQAASDADIEQKANITIGRAAVEVSTGRHNDALRILSESAHLFEATASHLLKGKFHHQLALVLRSLGAAERRQDHTERALAEYSAASYHFQQAGHESHLARTENELGQLLYTLGHHAEAQRHLNTAWHIFMTLKDHGSVALADETRARICLAQGQYQKALSLIRGAVRTLEKGCQQGLLAEALTTLGIAQARMEDFYPSLLTLQRAVKVAERAGATEEAARAALTLIEEHGERLPISELFKVYERADDLLSKSTDAEALARLRACARRMAQLAHLHIGEERSELVKSWDGFYLPDAVRAHEAKIIRQALIEEHGLITRAAHLLGITHQRLSYMLENKHQDLLPVRTPAQQRRKHIFLKSS